MPDNVNKTGDFKSIKAMFFIVIGTIVILGTLFWVVSNRRFIKNAATAKGIVTKLNAGGSHPEIKFTTNDGRTIEYPQGGLISGYQVGDEVSVLYDEKNPQTAVVSSFGALWGFPLLLFILGICFLGAGLYLRRT